MTAVILPENSWLFQLANCLLLVSYLLPSILLLRLVLSAACLCFTLWGAIVLNISVDTTVYNGVFTVINFTHFLYLLYQRRYVEVDIQLTPLYLQLFAPNQSSPMEKIMHKFIHIGQKTMHIDTSPDIDSSPGTPSEEGAFDKPCAGRSAVGGLSSVEFMELVRDSAYSGKINIRSLQNGEVFAKPGDVTSHLRILLTGKCIVLKEPIVDERSTEPNEFLHLMNNKSEQKFVGSDFIKRVMSKSLFFQYIAPFEFLDSPEYSRRIHRHVSSKRDVAFTVYVICDSSGEISKALTYTNAHLSKSNIISPVSESVDSTTLLVNSGNELQSGATYISISYQHLDAMKLKNPHLSAVIDNLIARDLTGKLFAVARSFSTFRPPTSPVDNREIEKQINEEKSPTNLKTLQTEQNETPIDNSGNDVVNLHIDT